MRHMSLETEWVEFVPEVLEPGVLYVSRRFSTASHLCCCGCGLEVVTPLNAAKWRLIERDGTVSLQPSIGNWGFPCQSHYWIERGRVRWAGALTKKQIYSVQARDRHDALAVRPARASPVAGLKAKLLYTWAAVIAWLRK